jgi:hypothetical protein
MALMSMPQREMIEILNGGPTLRKRHEAMYLGVWSYNMVKRGV